MYNELDELVRSLTNEQKELLTKIMEKGLLVKNQDEEQPEIKDEKPFVTDYIYCDTNYDGRLYKAIIGFKDDYELNQEVNRLEKLGVEANIVIFNEHHLNIITTEGEFRKNRLDVFDISSGLDFF